MTDAEWKEMTWYQLGAAIDMLEGALKACPDDLWQARLWKDKEFPASAEFWYVAYHAITFLDYYMSESFDGFAPPPPFTMSEFQEDFEMPAHVYTKAELQTYLEYSRSKTRNRIKNLRNLMELQSVRRDWIDMSVAELIQYTMRHIMEHEGQLSMLLGHHGAQGARWVSRTK